MVNIANTPGGSLVANLSPIAQGISGVQSRRREEASQFDLQQQLRQSLGLAPEEFTGPTGEGILGALPQIGEKALSLLGRISPEAAQMAGQVVNDPQASAEFRTQAQDGIALAAELKGLDPAARQTRLREEAGKVAARGEDVTRLAQLANMSDDQLGLELSRMEITGNAMLDAVPEFNPAEAFSVLSTPERAAAFAQVLQQNPQLGNTLLQGRERQITRQEQAAARQRQEAQAAQARAAAAAAPQTELGQTLAAIQRDMQTGAIAQDVGLQLIDNATGAAVTVPGEDPSFKVVDGQLVDLTAEGGPSVVDLGVEQGPEWRAATKEEAEARGAKAGQINTRTGKFNAINPPSGTILTVGADGSVKLQQGATGETAVIKPSDPNAMLNSINSILDDPALNTSTGILSMLQGLPGTPQFRFGTKVAQLQGQAFLQAIDGLRGTGQITEIEGNKATNAIGRLDSAQSADDYRGALNELKDVINTGLARRALGSEIQTGQPSVDLSVGAISQMTSDQLREIPRTAISGLSIEQITALRQRIAQVGGGQ